MINVILTKYSDKHWETFIILSNENVFLLLILIIIRSIQGFCLGSLQSMYCLCFALIKISYVMLCSYVYLISHCKKNSQLLCWAGSLVSLEMVQITGNYWQIQFKLLVSIKMK